MALSFLVVKITIDFQKLAILQKNLYLIYGKVIHNKNFKNYFLKISLNVINYAKIAINVWKGFNKSDA